MLKKSFGLLLAVDIGNTRIKWGIWQTSSRSFLTVQHVILTDVAAFIGQCSHIACDAVVFSNVADALLGEKISAALLGAGHRCVYQSEAVFSTNVGLYNYCLEPYQLGGDRWAAVVGAWSLYADHALIVNLGTAVTVECVERISPRIGHYLGGSIVPGSRVMNQSLAEHTARVRTTLVQVDWHALANTTSAAVSQGCWDAIVGAAWCQYVRFCQCLSVPCVPVIVSGGDGAVFLQQCAVVFRDVAISFVPELVLYGLVVLFEESQHCEMQSGYQKK